MQCPFCGFPDTKVTDSRLSEGGQAVRRRRGCESCGRRFTTYERLEVVTPLIVKKDQRREPFERAKVAKGIARACVKRPVSASDIEAMVDTVERQLGERGEREVPAAEVGARVIEALRQRDRVAYVRYASVYREFKDVEEFAAELQALAEPASPAASKPGESKPHEPEPNEPEPNEPEAK